MTSVLLMDAGFYARKAIPDDPDPQLCLLDSLLVFESRATAEAHLHVLEEAVEAEQLCCGLMVHRVPGRDPRTTTGWRLAGRRAASTEAVRHQVAALNVVVYWMGMASVPSLPAPGTEA